MATQQIKDILSTEIPKPTFVLRPTEVAPLPSKVSFGEGATGRPSAAVTQRPSGIYEYKSADSPLVYGKDQALVTDGERTNFVDHRQVGSGGWTQDRGTPSQLSTSTFDIQGGNAVGVEIEDNNTSIGEAWAYSHSISSSDKYWHAAIWLKADTFGSGNPGVDFEVTGGTEREIDANIHSDGTHTITYKKNGTENDESVKTRKVGSWIKVMFTLNVFDNTNANLRVGPARYSNDGDTSEDKSITGSCVVDAPLITSHDLKLLRDSNDEPLGVYDTPPILAERIQDYPTQVTRKKDTTKIDLTSVWNDYEGSFLFDVSITGASGSSPLRGANINNDFCELFALPNNEFQFGYYTPSGSPNKYISPPPNFGPNVNHRFVTSMTKAGGGKGSITSSLGHTLDGPLGNLLNGTVFEINENGQSTLFVNNIVYFPKYLSQQTREVLVSQA